MPLLHTQMSYLLGIVYDFSNLNYGFIRLTATNQCSRQNFGLNPQKYCRILGRISLTKDSYKIVIKADFLHCFFYSDSQLRLLSTHSANGIRAGGWLSECLRFRAFTDFTAYLLLWCLLTSSIYSARILGIQPIHYPCHPLITYCIYIETVYTYNIHSRFTTSNISCPSVYCIALNLQIYIHCCAMYFTLVSITVGTRFLYLSTPYLQRRFFPIE